MKANKISYLILFLVLIYVVFLLVLEHVKTITFLFPNEYREGHIYSTTVLLLKGINPYSLDTYPIYCNSYGILFNLIVFPFAYLFGNSLVLHRLVNACFIFATIFIVYRDYIHQKRFRVFNFILILVLYAGLIYSSNSVVRPDGLGIFLYVLTIVTPLRFNFSYKSIFFSMLFSIFAFYTKPYYLLGWIVITFYSFFFVNMKKTILCNFFFLIVFIVVGFIVNIIFPLYFYETIFIFSSFFGPINYSFKQIIDFYYLILPISVFFFILIVYLKKVNFLNLIRNPYGFLSVIILFFLIYPLGLNNGAYLTYHLQLLLPLLCLFLLSVDDSILNELKQNEILLVVMTFFLLKDVDLTPSFNNKDKTEWQDLSLYLKNKEKVLGGPALSTIMLDDNKLIYDNGNTPFVIGFRNNTLSNYLFGMDSLIVNKKNIHFNDLEKKINSKFFDAIILNSEWDGYYYNMIDTTKYKFKRKFQLLNPHLSTKCDVDVFEPR
jgi:hypothetical protein